MHVVEFKESAYLSLETVVFIKSSMWSLKTDDRSGLPLARTLCGRYDRRDAIRVHVSLRHVTRSRWEHVRFKANPPFRSCSPANVRHRWQREDKPDKLCEYLLFSQILSHIRCTRDVGIYLSFLTVEMRWFHVSPSPPPIHLRFECASLCGYPSLKSRVSSLLLLASPSFPLGEFIYLASPRPLSLEHQSHLCQISSFFLFTKISTPYRFRS